jgi:2-polyprenyl-3-methyl-5-hydroxy-6-metoxy-1,4-benzoquinol methylase
MIPEVTHGLCGDRVYANAGNPALLALIPATPGRILDCGCGAGDNARLLSQRGWRVTGITLSEAERGLASSYCEAVHVADLDLGLPETLPCGYDVVLMSHVLEHLVHPERIVQAGDQIVGPPNGSGRMNS